MKLYDTVIRSGYRHLDRGAGHVLVTDAPDVMREATVVDLSNVAQYVFQGVENEKNWSIRDFPNVAPPWDNVWLEYAEPATFLENGRQVRSEYAGDVRGNHMLSVRLDSGAWWSIVSSYWRPRGQRGNTPVLVGRISYFVLPDGQFLGATAMPVEFVCTPAESEAIAKAWGQPPHRGIAQELFGHDLAPDNVEALKLDLMLLARVVWTGISFAHCKNVTTVDHAPPPKVAAKRRKQGKPVGVTYKTLVIDGMKETLRTEGGVERNGLKKALHICRGHFATYTEDKPLFGKVTGTFWKPMHTRGSKRRGEVRKDYKVIAGG
jgi:hypothetical protein